jgi:hypothetical protein
MKKRKLQLKPNLKLPVVEGRRPNMRVPALRPLRLNSQLPPGPLTSGTC